MEIRRYTEDDYPMLAEWWKEWDFMPIPKHILSDIGVIVDDTAAAFLYVTNSSVAWIQWYISDKKISPLKRSRCFDALVKTLTDIAEMHGAKMLWTNVKKKSHEKRLVGKHGWVAGDRGKTELCRFMG